ncbi:MAG: 4Fe-4S binding protein [Chloroflexi bacterium]|nr:4Fe-4S binding protein [Chloroflexota bacterium]
MANLRTRLFGVEMPSPFVLASGPLSYGAEGIWAAYRAGAGGVTTKTLRLEPAINPTPHIVVPRSSNLRATLFNSEKWADLPWTQWVESELPALKNHPGILIVSLGHTAAEAQVIAGPVVETQVVDAIECVAYRRDALPSLVRAVRDRTDLPILAKLTFNWGDELYETAQAALDAGANGYTAIDSIGPTLEIDVNTGQPRIGGAGNRAWMSGAAIRPVAQAVVAELVSRFNVPVIGTGGIFSAEDAVEMTMVGAAAVSVCTAPLLRGLAWFGKSSERLNRWLDERGYADLAEVRGIALSRLHTADGTTPLTFDFEPTLCTLCRLCIIVCAYAARQIEGEKPRDSELKQILDTERCRSCGLCVEVCKPAALRYGNWPREQR